MLHKSFSKEIFPNIQSKPPLMQLEALSSRPITSYLGEETNTYLATTSFQVFVDLSPASLPFFGHAPAPQCPSCSEGSKTKHSNRGVTSPVLSSGDDQFPSPDGHTIPDTSQDAVGLLDHLVTLLAHVQPAVDQQAQILFHWAILK